MYIGNLKVKSVKDNVVTFEDGFQEEFTEAMLEVIQTEEKTDLTELRQIRCNPVIEEISENLKETGITSEDDQLNYCRSIMASFKKWGVYYSEVDFILQSLVGKFQTAITFTANNVENGRKKAIGHLWGRPEVTQSFIEADRLIREADAEEGPEEELPEKM